MAHNVVVDKAPVLSKDGSRILKGKYTYKVRCKRCGDLHDEKISSESFAAGVKNIHHFDMLAVHGSKHPNDKAHVRANRNKMKKAGTRG